MFVNGVVPIGDDALSTAVRSRLQMELGLTHDVVKATVANGVVTLKGRLASTGTREAAGAAAGNVRGIKRVVNDISTAYHLVRRLAP